MTWSTNGLSRFQFDVDVEKQEPGEEMAPIGTWSARPLRPEHQPSLDFIAGQEGSLILKSNREVLQVVTGVQHPFMYHNENEGEGAQNIGFALIGYPPIFCFSLVLYGIRVASMYVKVLCHKDRVNGGFGCLKLCLYGNMS